MKVIYFAPYSAIWLHSVPEALTAQSLQDKGHEVIYVTCGGLFEAGCMSMTIYGINSNSNEKSRKEICKICMQRKESISKNYNLTGYSLENFIYPEDRAYVEGIISNLTFLDFEYQLEEIRLGRAALYYVILAHKKTNLNFSREIWQEYLIELKHTIYSFLAAKRIFEKEKPDSMVVYNTSYPTNNAFRLAAHKLKIVPYFIHAGSNLKHRVSTLQFGKDNYSQIIGTLIAEWPRFKHIPSTQKNIQHIVDHFYTLSNGNSPFVFSKCSNYNLEKLNNFFKIKNNQKVCVAVLSSSDEYYAQFVFENFLPPRLKKIPFENQEAWCSALIAYFKLHPELILIIRVHPRIMENHRDNVRSEYTSTLETLFSTLPENVKVNWPKDKISLYDLANIADIFLNSWSSVGKEICLLGIPVLTYGHAWLLYPFDLNYIGESTEDYFEKLHIALKNGWDLEISRKAFRWYILEQVHALLDLSESFSFNENTEISYLNRIVNKIKRMLNSEYLFENSLRSKKLNASTSLKIETILLQKLNTPLSLFEPKNYTPNDLALETIYIKKALKKMITNIGGYNSFKYGKLRKNFDDLQTCYQKEFLEN